MEKILAKNDFEFMQPEDKDSIISFDKDMIPLSRHHVDCFYAREETL